VRTETTWDADEAVTQLYAAHYTSLVRLGALLLRDAGAAEDVVQDAFVAMHGKWGRLRDPHKAHAYLRQAVVNRARSALRHRSVVARHRPPLADPHNNAAEAEEVVFCANDRCQQENLLAQLHSGCRALKAPADTLASNWAYMVMTALAWDLKAWWALLLPEGRGRHRAAYRADKRWVLGLEFKRFVQAFVCLPCQVVRTGRRLLYRLLSWNPYQPIFFRLVAVLRC